jgi:hypothetical protein
MPLIIFIDALPYNFIMKNKVFDENIFSVVQLEPNIGYSSNLHWQLFENKYPDEIGFFTDWSFVKEKNKSIRFISFLLRPLEIIPKLSLLTKKVLDRYIYNRNAFSNVPSRFRNKFMNNAKYYFFESENLLNSSVFKQDYTIIFQDELKVDYHEILKILKTNIVKTNSLFLSISTIDEIGHKLSRTNEYDSTVFNLMSELKKLLMMYIDRYNEEVLIISDHGMSPVKNEIKLDFTNILSKKEIKKLIDYKDSAVMKKYCEDYMIISKLRFFLTSLNFGHLLTEDERIYYGVTDRAFGNLIFILHDGYVFSDSWFSKSIIKKKLNYGMHGFWPKSEDQQAVIITANSTKLKKQIYTYKDAYNLIKDVAGN